MATLALGPRRRGGGGDGAPLPVGEEKVRKVRSMFDAIAPRYDLLNRIMTLGLDRGWRRAGVEALGLPPASVVLDVACGTGDFCRELEARGFRANGFDNSGGMLGRARTAAPLVQADALALPVAGGAADGVTCGFALRNVAGLERLFFELARILRPGGRIAILEVAEPRLRIVRAFHHLYFHRVVPLIGGLLSDRDAYRYLPRSTAYLPPSPELLSMLERAGFRDCRIRLVGLGAAQIISGSRT
ncbi:MAG: ubiquinone/menaquinone biosynthesis methyltransferase [Actinomycetota bacterium]|nr:ubiquinone/menaquinone biosynthesis methyltransferase [Actinomycetota bacterium]